MQKPKFLLIFVVTTTLAITSQAAAMGEKASERKAALTQPASKVFTAMGRVTGNNSQNSTITISTSAKGSLTLVVDKNSEIIKGWKNITASEICWNDFVSVSYEIVKGKNIAKSVSVQEKSAVRPK